MLIKKERRLGKSQVTMFLVLTLPLILFGASFLPMNLVFVSITQVRGADGAVGSVSVSTTMVLEGLPVAIEAWDLTNDAAYHINHTNDDTGVTFTASGTTYDWVYANVASPSSGSTITVYLRAGAAGTEINTATFTVFAITDFLVTAVIISAGIFVLIVVIIKRVAKQ